MRNLLLGLLVSGVFLMSSATAGIIAQGTLSTQQDADGINWDHSIVLTNTSASDTTIGTFWFAWIPGQDYMHNKPLSITSPTGWVAISIGGPLSSTTNGWAIQ